VNYSELPVRHSLFDPKGLVGVLDETYHLTTNQEANPVFIQFYSRGSNDLYKVTVGDRSYLLRISRFGSRSDYVQGEIDLLNDLAQTTLPAPSPVKAKDDSYLCSIQAPEGNRLAVLFNYLEGSFVRWAVDTPTCRALGEACARFHRWADQVEDRYKRPQIDPTFLLETPIERLDRLRLLSSADLAWVKALAETIRPHLLMLPQETPFYGLCHGDMHHANALRRDNSIALLDFDFCGYGHRVYDLATYKASVWDESLQSVFFEGYGAVREISEVELGLIPYFVVARQIWSLGHIALGGEHWGLVWTADRMRGGLEQLRIFSEALDQSP
jgi:Ser/Thr protein kinase RdoA (MazF antagonist)